MMLPSFDLVFEGGKIAARLLGVNDAEAANLTNLNFHSVPEDWLTEANRRYRRDSIPPKRRPFQALCDYSKEHHAAINFSSPAASRVFAWFQQRSTSEAHQIEPMFIGSYFYDAWFWPVSIGIGWGKFKLNALDSLQTMPVAVKEELTADVEELWVYVLYWADCVDYAYGYDDIRRGFSKVSEPVLALLRNADHELRSATTQTNATRLNPHAALNARLAVETFLDALLVAKGNWEVRALRAFNHNITKLCDEVQRVCGLSEIEIIKRVAEVFPPHNDRYTGDDLTPSAVGNTVSTCQMVAATVIRQFTDRDIRPQVYRTAIPQQ